MEKHGKDSCTGRSRHIDIRNFFVQDRIDKGELEVEHCPTKLMLADYMTKTLQGSQFQLLRYAIMGWKSIEDIIVAIRDSSKERVGNVTENSNNKNKGNTFKEIMLAGV